MKSEKGQHHGVEEGRIGRFQGARAGEGQREDPLAALHELQPVDIQQQVAGPKVRVAHPDQQDQQVRPGEEGRPAEGALARHPGAARAQSTQAAEGESVTSVPSADDRRRARGVERQHEARPDAKATKGTAVSQPASAPPSGEPSASATAP